MSMKMKATFIEAYIWYLHIIQPDKLNELIQQIIMVGNQKN